MPRYSESTGLPQQYQVGPFLEPHLYLQWGGGLPGGEQWSNGLRFQSLSGTVATPADQEAMIAGCVTALTTWHTSGSKANAAATLTFVKLNAIGADGLYVRQATTMTPVGNLGGQSFTPLYPNQVALAVTTETGFSRGPAHRGRFYVPIPTLAVGADGRIIAPDWTGLKTAAATLRTNLNAVNAGYKLAVFSRKAGAPAVREITSMSVGRVLDTQRRRRHKLPEGY